MLYRKTHANSTRPRVATASMTTNQPCFCANAECVCVLCVKLCYPNKNSIKQKKYAKTHTPLPHLLQPLNQNQKPNIDVAHLVACYPSLPPTIQQLQQQQQQLACGNLNAHDDDDVGHSTTMRRRPFENSTQMSL